MALYELAESREFVPVYFQFTAGSVQAYCLPVGKLGNQEILNQLQMK
jgi:hypothetical protein